MKETGFQESTHFDIVTDFVRSTHLKEDTELNHRQIGMMQAHTQNGRTIHTSHSL